MPIYCVSDLHLHDDDQPYLFDDFKQRVFVQVAREATERGGFLILAGDILDMNGMTPPQGLDEFFAAVLAPQDLLRPDIVAAGVRRPPAELVAAVVRRFPDFFAALRTLAQTERLTWIPGNHDDAIGRDAAAQAVLAAALEIAPARLRMVPTCRVDEFLIAAHGNEFDDSNRTDGGHDNRGAAITRSLYRAVMPALAVLGIASDVIHAIPAVRPEENIVSDLTALLGPERTPTFLLAFVKLLEKNGYFIGLPHFQVWFATHIAHGLITADRVRAGLADDNDLWQKARAGAQDILAGRLLGSAGTPPPRVVVLGHTHVLDAMENYVNLGTWIDHVEGLSPASLIAVERSLPVLCIEDDHCATLRDAAQLLSRGSLAACPSRWSCGVGKPVPSE